MAWAPVCFAACNDLVGHQIRLARGRRAEQHGLVGQLHVARFLVGLGIHRHGVDAHLVGGGDDAAGDFAAVGDQDFGEHDDVLSLEWWSADGCCPAAPQNRLCRAASARPLEAVTRSGAGVSAQSGMFPCLRHGFSSFLSLQHHQRAADALAGFVRQDHVVDEAARTGHEGVGKAGLVFGFLGGQLGRVALVFAEDDFHRALGAHHRDLGVGPGEVDVAAQVLGGHHVVGAAVGLAGDHGDLGHGALGVGVEQLGAVLDDAAVLLRGAGHEAGHVHEGDHRDVEGIAEAHKARGLDASS